MTKRIEIEKCSGAVIDVQEYFLAQLEAGVRQKIESGTADFAALLSYLQIPLTFTIERPIAAKGQVPAAIQKCVVKSAPARTFEKDFFDLTGEKEITEHLRSLKRPQIILAGCETDVCVLQSCLGLLNLGYEVYVIEDLLFSSSKNVDSAIGRMKSEGATFMTLKTLHYELLRAVGGSAHSQRLEKQHGPRPQDFPDL
ncbi:MAG: isochorismatase family protein [Bdellovibrionales bacterium]